MKTVHSNFENLTFTERLIENQGVDDERQLQVIFEITLSFLKQGDDGHWIRGYNAFTQDEKYSEFIKDQEEKFQEMARR